MLKKSVIYVNFSPYDNTGRTLDYLIENYYNVAHFSFDHLRLKNNRRAKLTFYNQGKIVDTKNLSWLKTHSLLLFPSLPFVALAMLIETLWHSYFFKRKIGKVDYFLTVNAYPAVCGVILRKLGIVKKTVFWVWDYYPTNFPDWRMRAIRKSYLAFDQFALRNSDRVVFLNNFLKKSREKQGIKFKHNKQEIIPIGTNPSNGSFKKRYNIIGHMGLIKESQGLDLLFNNLDAFFKAFPQLKIEIIGTGPEEELYKRKSKKFRSKVKFYGFMEKAEVIDKLIRKWKIGIATYSPNPWSEHYYGDPSKIKAYIANGIPVITTSVPEFSKEIKKEKAGIVIDYKKEELFKAIEKLLKENLIFSKNALRLSKKYYYKKIYSRLLS